MSDNAQMRDERALELFESAVTEEAESARYKAIVQLHKIGSRFVLEKAREMIRNDDLAIRRIAADVLGQLGVPERTFPSECAHIILEVLPKEAEPDVLNAMVVALGHISEDCAVTALCGLSAHESTQVRFAVAFALGSFVDEITLPTLITLCSDDREEVRDWATFAIGTLTEIDTNEVRDALRHRLTDSSRDVRAEAMIGLAIRHEESVLPAIIAELERDDVGTLVVEAAAELADSRLQEPLNKLSDTEIDDEDFLRYLSDAIERCKPQ